MAGSTLWTPAHVQEIMMRMPQSATRQLGALLPVAVMLAWACAKSPGAGEAPPPPPSTVTVAELADVPGKARMPAWEKHATPAHGPSAVALPEDAMLAAWTANVEAAFFPALELQGMARRSRDNAAGPKLVERALAAWERVKSAGLPPDDHIRLRAAAALIDVLMQNDPLRAAVFAEHSGHPRLARSLYERAGKTAEAARAEAAAEVADKATEAFSAQYKSTYSLTRKELLSTPEAWLAFFTSGPIDPWVRGCEHGAAKFLEHVPDNPRLRRALLLYYQPCRACGLSPIERELDVVEPLLRLTAEAFPSDVARTFAFWLDSPIHSGIDTGSPRIPGDYGTTGNVLAVVRDVLGKAPQAKDPLLAVAVDESQAASNPGDRARWIGLASYLADGAPEPTEALLVEKLGASISQQRWALAWLPNKLGLPDGHHLSVRNPSEALRSATVAAWSRSSSQIDRLLVLDALHSMPPATGIDVLVAAASSADAALQKLAIAALVRQFKPVGGSGNVQPFAASLPELRRAFYPFLCRRAEASSLLAVFSDLGDTELDSAIAGCLTRMTEPDTSLMQSAASNAMLHPRLAWRRTAAAFRELATRPGFAQADYALRLADDLAARR